jgi:hypothetical protein
MSCLQIPTSEDINQIANYFVLDLELFTVTDEVSKQIKPVICSICDSILTKAMEHDLCLHRGFHQAMSSWKTFRLRDLVSSPETYVNNRHEVLLCKQCLSKLRSNMERTKSRRRSPAESIIQGYMIGDAPDVLSKMNPVELFLITKTVTLHNEVGPVPPPMCLPYVPGVRMYSKLAFFDRQELRLHLFLGGAHPVCVIYAF